MDKIYPGGMIWLILLFAMPLNLDGQSTNTSQKIEKADSLIDVEDFDTAIQAWEALANLNSISKKEKALFQSKIHYAIGLKLSKESKYTEAAKAFEDALAAGYELEAEKHATFLKDLHTSYYHALAYSGDWENALAAAVSGFTHIGAFIDGKDKADYIYDLGFLNDKVGNFAEAIQLYEASIQELKKLDGDHTFDIGLAYNNLSTNYKKMGFFSARLNSLVQAQKFWESKPETVEDHYFITLYGNLLKVYLEYGDIALAEKMLHKTDSILQAEGNLSPGQIINQHRLHIILHTARNQVENASERLDDFYTYYLTLSDANRKKYHTYLLAGIQSLVDNQVSANQTETSAHYLDIGLEIARKYNNLYYQMALNSEYSKISDRENEPPSAAIAYLDKALSVNEKTNIGQENLMTLNLRKAHYYNLDQQPDSARKYIQIALNNLEGFDGNDLYELSIDHFERQNSVYIINALINAAELHLLFDDQNNDNNDAMLSLHLYELAARVFESYYQKGSYNASLNSVNKDIVEGIFTALQVLGKPLSADLLELLEQNKSQTLRKEFEAKQQEYTALPIDLLNNRNLLSARFAELRDASLAFPDSIALSRRKTEIQREINALTQRIDSIDPQFDKLYPSDLTVLEIQKKLSDRELIIQYVQGRKSSFAVLISGKDCTLYTLGSRPKIDSLVTDYHESIKNPGSEIDALSERCYRALILPFEDKLKEYGEVIIIPDGKLNYLAFESLKPENSTEYLVHSHYLSYSPSLSLWYLTASSDRPDPGIEKKRMAAFAPVYTAGYYTDRRSENTENRLVNIEGATREAKRIAQDFGGDFYTRDDASKRKFIGQTNNYEVYHLAMHTIYADEDTENSKLVFQNEEKLSFNELYALHFPAEMVVLSACNTGIGQLRDGEGMQSLSQALTYSGVQSSVYSLWPVPDKETAEIMLLFYENLKLGFSKRTALAEAKKAFISENPLKNHPYFWAGFVLQGNQNAIMPASTYWPYGLGIAIILVILTAVIWRRLR